MSRFGPLVIDTDSHRVLMHGVDVGLTRSEFALLVTLAAHPGSAMGNRDLLRAMWGAEWHADTTPLQLHISRLRRKLGESGRNPRHIITIHGFGYRFEPNPSGRVAGLPDGEHDQRERGHLTRRSVTLAIDSSLVLRDITPRMPVLGWAPEEILGRFFSPTGLDEGALRGLIGQLIAIGTLRTEGPIEVRHRDGTWLTVHSTSHLRLDRSGEFDGLLSTLLVPPTPPSPDG